MNEKSILSNRINSLSESATLKMTQLGRELAEKGVEVISLSVGEPDYHTPDHVKEAGKKAIDENFTQYSPVPGYMDLRLAIAEKLKNENNLEYSPQQIVVSTGAKQSLSNVILALINPGEEVIIPTPYWVSYSEMVLLAEGKSVFIPTGLDSDFKITAAQLEEAITPKTKAIMFSSPCNPTGSVYSKEELESLAKVIEKHPNIFIISDEIYEHINFVGSHESIAQFPSIKDRVVIVNGFSKAYAMTGWRLGYIAANSTIAQACNKLQGQTTSGTCSIAQKAGVAAYKGGLEAIEEMKKGFSSRRELVYQLLSDIPGIQTNKPEGAFYFFPQVNSFFGKKDAQGNTINNSSDLALYLLNTAHVAVVAGDAFGNDDYIRISYAASEEQLKKALKRIKDALAELK
ncbi:MAG TPA: pyridoxal phosphate-dependent aminotransferase [Candidatus Sphingobacterium stercoripullorum]|nr:pyridoxal phosphate-dependent aminotransferase [Candidatus Sphingobacterium stercoripullorum]